MVITWTTLDHYVGRDLLEIIVMKAKFAYSEPGGEFLQYGVRWGRSGLRQFVTYEEATAWAMAMVTC